MGKHQPWETDDAMLTRLLTMGCSPEECCRELNIAGQSMSYWLVENGRAVARAWATAEVQIRAAQHMQAMRGNPITAAHLLTLRDILLQRMNLGKTDVQGGMRRRGPRH